MGFLQWEPKADDLGIASFDVSNQRTYAYKKHPDRSRGVCF